MSVESGSPSGSINCFSASNPGAIRLFVMYVICVIRYVIILCAELC